ncbi:MAG: cupin domain-containing protein [Lentisphaerae bacterium]|nr:cupin domain-containing protein [Victivallaceae bacterium]MDD3702654.1 cupin domain-containing protein [Victivallaceae bacterium]MDD5664186.1 cupin domain-containing protein [Victivallaceae bacterium]NLK83156.1 cupin domain-containing protein [Lentisphaerota bacterium]
MIKKTDQLRCETREKMRGGDGCVRIEHLWEPKSEMKSLNRMVSRLILEPGSSIGAHRHDGEDEIFYIVRGTAQVDDDGNIAVLKAGDTILTGNAQHSLKNIGDDTLEVLAIISLHHDGAAQK